MLNITLPFIVGLIIGGLFVHFMHRKEGGNDLEYDWSDFTGDGNNSLYKKFDRSE
jgi:hypothetical protein